MTHTPTPWRVGDAGHTVFGPKTENPSPKTIAINLTKEDAAFIVKAVNCHEELVRCLKETTAAAKHLMNLIPMESIQNLNSHFDGFGKRAKEAIAKAEEYK